MAGPEQSLIYIQNPNAFDWPLRYTPWPKPGSDTCI